MRIRTMAAFAAGVMVAAAGTAFATTKVASIVGPDNKINGCYLTSAGLLRVVPAGTACRDGESAIAWSATGSGAPGPAGPKGDPGVRWRGPWISGTEYSGGDLVRSGAKIWIRQSGLITCFVDRPCSNAISPAGSAGWAVFANDGLAGQVGPRGPQGAVGPAGPKGDAGPRGVEGGVSGHQIVTGPLRTVGAYSATSSVAQCPAGKVVVGGGYDTEFETSVVFNGPWGGDTAWRAAVQTGLGGSEIKAWAICVSKS